uniref:Uncharacterized protein n=1 Tax=Steinernema glaseri TaxID=37863 RepID=A0A1I7ZK64_9BILA
MVIKSNYGIKENSLKVLSIAINSERCGNVNEIRMKQIEEPTYISPTFIANAYLFASLSERTIEDKSV